MYRKIEEIQAEMLQYKKYEDVPKELRTEYNKISLQMIQQEEDERYKREHITRDIPLDRLEEICNAERDGRLVVLPCKVGDKVWIIKNNNIHGNFAVQYHLAYNKEQSFLSMHGEYCNFTDFGKTVFLTKESAEKALKGGAE